ncbi:hypothetical protein MettiDRAFT_0598 [Methanolobus tindarius DSM 2278]|uniref:Uncharacterized protein n=1 Tax=Methanolobus tindarius DSM 2278 TaxID=1090322 RepID=W9DPT1_METTI|nr:hypothetical protein [Methanolobus tindarius]ETA67185.1 hypothetical protein MettiDRAFT_0598 [Methanolobus tindarius DSM 2278]
MNSWTSIKLNEYKRRGLNCHFDYLITAISYEERGLESTKQILINFNISTVLLINFGTKYLSDELTEKWLSQKKELESFLNENNIVHDIFETELTNYQSLKQKFDLIDGKTIVNITTFPKNWILMLAKEFDGAHNLFFYLIDSWRIPTDDELDIGLKDIVVVDGFEGETDLTTEILLVLILGYEGHRTISFLSNFSSDIILPIISVPSKGDKKEDELFYDNVYKCNWGLLNKNSVVRTSNNKIHTISSFSPVDFYHQLIEIVSQYKNVDVCISPLGTKIQTLGLYLFCRDHPKTQVVYSIPIKRVNITEDLDKVKKKKSNIENNCYIFKLPSEIN